MGGDSHGVALSLLIATASFLLSKVHASFEPLAISIIFGMLLSNVLANREQLQKGIDIMLRFFLPVGIALYGTQLTFSNNIGYQTWFSILVVFAFTFFSALVISRALRLPSQLSLLLATGISVCGASAIAVLSPLVRARREDTSISIISIMVMGLTAVILYPTFHHIFGLSGTEYAFFSGVTIPMMGQVKIAAQGGGPGVAALALKFKLIRVSMILCVALGMLFLHGRKEKGFSVPGFMIAFLVLAVAVNLIDAMEPVPRLMEPVCKFLLSSALAAIGLSVDFDSITSEGGRPLIAVFASWGIAMCFVAAGLRLFNV